MKLDGPSRDVSLSFIFPVLTKAFRQLFETPYDVSSPCYSLDTVLLLCPMLDEEHLKHLSKEHVGRHFAVPSPWRRHGQSMSRVCGQTI